MIALPELTRRGFLGSILAAAAAPAFVKAGVLMPVRPIVLAAPTLILPGAVPEAWSPQVLSVSSYGSDYSSISRAPDGTVEIVRRPVQHEMSLTLAGLAGAQLMHALQSCEPVRLRLGGEALGQWLVTGVQQNLGVTHMDTSEVRLVSVAEGVGVPPAFTLDLPSGIGCNGRGNPW